MTIKRINLALQGGGAHGAFTWGVLDRLLQEPELEIAAMSGTSAGAMNGAAIKSGLALSGRELAREKLDWLWHRIGAIRNDDLTRLLKVWAPPTAFLSQLIEYSPAYTFADMASRLYSPYALGPLGRNPLEPVVEELFCETLCTTRGPMFHICATNVRSGKIKVFDHTEMSVQAILASACLPTLFQAVEIEDENGESQAYWDGGYTGNPALFPLFATDLPDDIVIININPLHREDLPRSPQQIQNRINEISFNSSLFRELRAIDFVRRLLTEGRMPDGAMKRVLIHMIADDDLMTDLSVATKMMPSPLVLEQLRDAGRRAADKFLAHEIDKVGVSDSVDLREMFG